MPLNETDKDWILHKIHVAHRRHGWRKFARFIKDWSGVVAFAGILIFFVTQWTDYTQMFARTADRLNNVETTLKQVSREHTKQSLINYAGFAAGEFKTSLPDLDSALAEARQEHLEVSPRIVDDLARKLASTDTTAPDFWPVAAQLVSYRSLNGSQDPLQLVYENRPNCTNSDPAPMENREVGSKGNIKKLASAYYEHCQFTLDSVEDESRINFLVLNKFSVIEFRDCLVVYRGKDFTLTTYENVTNGPVNVLTGKGERAAVSYTSSYLVFIRCLFDFSVSIVPAQGEQILQLLLTQNGSSLMLPIANNSTPPPPKHN